MDECTHIPNTHFNKYADGAISHTSSPNHRQTNMKLDELISKLRNKSIVTIIAYGCMQGKKKKQ